VDVFLPPMTVTTLLIMTIKGECHLPISIGAFGYATLTTIVVIPRMSVTAVAIDQSGGLDTGNKSYLLLLYIYEYVLCISVMINNI